MSTATVDPPVTRATAVTATIDAHDARYLVDAVLPAVSKDDVTPVICGALWSITVGQVELTATDRYRVHRVRGEAETEGDGQFIVPRDALVWLYRNANVWGRRRNLVTEPKLLVEFDPAGTIDPRFRFTVVEGLGTTHRQLSYDGPLTKGNFPQVYKLIDKARAAGTADPGRVRLDYLAAAGRLSYDQGDVPRIKYTQGEGAKPGPMLLELRRGEVLIQPNLDLAR